jgi:hypothetical protein
MDYCSSCRRHLNGALVCPGCGAYAPDIAPPVTHGSGNEGLAAHTGRKEPSAPLADHGWFDAGAAPTAPPAAATDAPRAAAPPAPAADATVVPSADTTDAPPADVDVTDAPPAPQGRAARRRQLARWKKNQRRAVVATAVALVGGGLTLASLDRGSGDRAQAATAPDNRSMGLTEEPSAAPSRPASTPAPPAQTRHRHTPAAPTARTPAVRAPRQQNLAATPHAAQQAQHTHTAAVAAPPAAPAAPQPQSTAPASSGTTAATSGGSGTSGSTGTSGTTAQPAPAHTAGSGSTTSPADPASTSPHQLCLVLVCLG